MVIQDDPTAHHRPTANGAYMTKGLRVVRTTSLRVALNDLRRVRDEDVSDLPAVVMLDDGMKLEITPFVASKRTEGYTAGTVVDGVFAVTRTDTQGRKKKGFL